MEFSYNYSALIQLAVTFSFVFVVLREDSVSLASQVISAVFKEARRTMTKKCDLDLQQMPLYSLDLCAEGNRDSLKKSFDTVNSHFYTFFKLIEWKPIYMAPWCLMCGLYCLVLLILYAELNEVQGYLWFFQVFVELCTLLHFYYLLLEIWHFFKGRGTEVSRNSYTKPLMTFLGIIIVCFVFAIWGISFGSPIVSVQFLFYWSLILAFIPLISVSVLAGLFFLAGHIYENLLNYRIDELQLDFKNARKMVENEEHLSFGKPGERETISFGPSRK